MTENQTKPTKAAVKKFLDAKVPEADRRADCDTIVALMENVTKCPAVMWGPAIVGFGTYHYKYESGREGDAPVIGFSPRKTELTLYGLDINHSPELMEKLGKYKNGKSCLYIKKLSDVHAPTLEALIKRGVDARKRGRVD
ncbi:MAG: DUF1801 domain-containing protein [Gemmatimonas sp.]